MTEFTTAELENLIDRLHNLTLQRQTAISESTHTVRHLESGTQYPAQIVDDSTIYVDAQADIPLHSTVNVHSDFTRSHGTDCLVTAVTTQAGRKTLQVLPIAGRFGLLQDDGSQFVVINNSLAYVKVDSKNYVPPSTVTQGDIVDPAKGPLLQVASVVPADNGLDEIVLNKYQGGAV
jgi:hypothetical protein